MRPVAPQKEGPPANEDIQSQDVQLIDAEGVIELPCLES